MGVRTTRTGFGALNVDWADLPIETRLDAWRATVEMSHEPDAFIYCVQQGDSGLIKIGRARNPESRLKSMQTGNAETLHLRAAAWLPGEMEWVIHRELKPWRYRGEWFQPTVEVVNVVALLNLWSNAGRTPSPVRRGREAEKEGFEPSWAENRPAKPKAAISGTEAYSTPDRRHV